MRRLEYYCKDNNYQLNLAESDKNIIPREPSLVDEFYSEMEYDNLSGEECTAYRDPIYLLFNEERLKKMGNSAVKMWLDTLIANNSSGVKELLKNCSDEDLMDMVKSRHIQQPSELKAYLDWCNENIEEFNKQVAAAKEAEAKLTAATMEAEVAKKAADEAAARAAATTTVE